MGIGFVLVIWLVFGSILAAIGSAILVSVTSKLTRGVDDSIRHAAIRGARLLPFACLLWVGIVFVAQAVANSEFMHRDIGIGDSSYAPLPNGYQISFGDVADQGTIRVAGSDSGLNGARLLQVSGPYLFGGTDSHWFEHFGSDTGAVDSYIVIDTRTRRKTSEPDFDALASEALRLGVSLHLEPIYTVYSRYRFTWFDVLSGCMLVLPPLAGFAALGFWIMRLRRLRATSATA